MQQRNKRLVSGAMFALALILMFTQMPSYAQEAQEQAREENARHFSANARRLEGVWESEVTMRNCQTNDAIRSFRGRTLFIRGGAAIGTNNNPQIQSSPALGQWEYLGGRRYRATFSAFRFNPDGSFAGVVRQIRNITLSQDGDQLTITVNTETFDADDRLIATGCATDTARRVE